MKQMRKIGAALLAGALSVGGYAADTNYPDILNGQPTGGANYGGRQYQPGDEIPFVEGQTTPLAPQGYAWCLEKRPAATETVRNKVKVREESWYYESVPPRYELRPEQVMIEPERKQAVLVAPARYVDQQERRLIKPESVEYRTVPAEYATVNEEVVVAPESREQVMQEAKYDTYTERVMIQPERTIRVEVPGCDTDSNKVECYSTRTIPAEYRTVTKTRLVEPARMTEKFVPAQKRTMPTQKVVRPARVEEVKIPAQYETIDKKVLAEPAKYRYDTIPAKYETVQRQVMVEPEGKRRVQIPAKYDEVSTTRIIKPERLVWVLNRQEAAPPVAVAPAPRPAQPKKGCAPLSLFGGRKDNKIEHVR
ncbi:MAG: hypothetical protein LBP75_11845 [Planctomycetota bacterium]|jgi:hypothetical protein|nr:hypothetical protein [Planctomycetota bacterium]